MKAIRITKQKGSHPELIPLADVKEFANGKTCIIREDQKNIEAIHIYNNGKLLFSYKPRLNFRRYCFNPDEWSLVEVYEEISFTNGREDSRQFIVLKKEGENYLEFETLEGEGVMISRKIIGQGFHEWKVDQYGKILRKEFKTK